MKWDPDFGERRVSAGELERRSRPQPPKRFDTRLLDQLESYCAEYRHWHKDYFSDYPGNYVLNQREAMRVGLREAALRVAKALDGDYERD